VAQVLLLNPTYRGRSSHFMMPSGLLCVAGVLQANGHNVQILDSHVHQYNPLQSLQAISVFAFDILGIGGISTSYYFWKEFVPLFQKEHEGVPIMAGGSVAATMPEFFLTHVDVDAICMGDAEPVIAELTECLLNHQSLDDLDGIGFRDGEKLIVRQGLRVNNMDVEVHIPSYDLININDYRKTVSLKDIRRNYTLKDNRKKNIIEFILFSSRGCPYNCFFCSSNFGRQFKQHSVDNLIEHISFVTEKYLPDLLHFSDELMTTNRKWIMDFCERYKATGLKIPYRINARVDTIDRDLLVTLKDSGCYEVDFGIESGSPTILKEMNKGVTVEQNRKALRLCKELGLYANVTMVFGMPSETLDTIRQTEAFLIEEDVGPFGGFFATAYPASSLFEYAISKGLIQNIDEYMLKVDNASKLVINYTALSDKELRKKLKKVSENAAYAWQKKRGMSFLEWKLLLIIKFVKRAVHILKTEGVSGFINKVKVKLKDNFN